MHVGCFFPYVTRMLSIGQVWVFLCLSLVNIRVGVHTSIPIHGRFYLFKGGLEGFKASWSMYGIGHTVSAGVAVLTGIAVGVQRPNPAGTGSSVVSTLWTPSTGSSAASSNETADIGPTLATIHTPQKQSVYRECKSPGLLPTSTAPAPRLGSRFRWRWR